MATMAKLPFVIAPKMKTRLVRLGDENIGVVEIEKRGYLSVAEKSFVDTVMQGSDGVSSMVRLSSKIAREKKTTVEKAYMTLVDILGGKTSGSGNTIINNYGDEISEIQTQMIESIQRKSIACTTVLIQSRINSEWTIEDTMELQPELLAEFVKFYDEEEQKIDNAKKESQSEEEAAEIVGK